MKKANILTIVVLGLGILICAAATGRAEPVGTAFTYQGRLIDANWADGGSYELLGGFWPGGPLCMVDLDDFAGFAEHWLDSGCEPENEWCGGAEGGGIRGIGREKGEFG